MTPPMRGGAGALRVAVLCGVAALAASKIHAGITTDLAATLATAGDNPWGLVGLGSLWLGFIAFGIVLWRFEPNRRIALTALALTPAFGNLVLAGWMAWRGLALLRPRP
jgi:hypothetical protein